MIKLLKKYWTHILNILLFLFLIFLFSNANLLMTSNLTLGILVILGIELLLVIAIWIEIIYYIIYVAKSKDIPNRGIKALLMYMLCYWYIPCFKLKYIDKDKNYKSKNIIYLAISIILPILAIFIMFRFSIGDISGSSDTYKTYSSDDNIVEFSLPSSYRTRNVGEYDLYFSKGTKVNMGVFLYDDYNYNDLDILEFQEDWLLNNRDNLTLIDYGKINKDDKEINKVVYKNNTDVYTLSTISFDSKDDYVVYVIQISTVSYYENVKEELEEILLGIELNF